MIQIITGDLLDATEKYIAHQTNAISTGLAAGVARSIFDKYPYANCYADRTQQSIPGTIDVRGDGINNRFVINIHSQVYPGFPKYPTSDLDGHQARQKYFYRGLLRIAKIENLESIAFPWRVCCGLAGGDWEWTLGTISNFERFVEKQNVKVAIYKRLGDD